MNTTLCYIKDDKNRYLLIHKTGKENDLNAGKWIGVGGKFEEGETAEECVIREVYEETGLTLTKYRLHGLVKFVSDTWEDEDMYLFSADAFTGTLKERCAEGELCWVDADEVLKLPTWEGDRYFVGPLIEGRERIDMIVRYEGDRLVEHRDLSTPVMTLKSSVISCAHGFSTRKGGVSDGIFESLNLGMKKGDVKERVIENWNRFLDSCMIKERSFVCARQVHGNTVLTVGTEDIYPPYGKEDRDMCDGFVTDKPGVPLVVFTSDCVPLLLEDKAAHVIGAVHCGWRSTVADIEKNAIDAMMHLGAKPANIHAAIGPAIDKCCFEVGAEVIEAVCDLCGEAAGEFYEKRTGTPSGGPEKFMLDLRGIVEKRLIMLGLSPENTEKVGGCTMCDPSTYYSHRGIKGNRASLASVIAMED